MENDVNGRKIRIGKEKKMPIRLNLEMGSFDYYAELWRPESDLVQSRRVSIGLVTVTVWREDDVW